MVNKVFKEVGRVMKNKQKNSDKENLNKLKNKLPKECRNCSFLKIRNVAKKKVYCFYRGERECILKKYTF